MAKLNLYKIDQNKKEDFLQNLQEELNFINTKEKQNTNQELYKFSLYNYFPAADKSLSWNWLLSEFDEDGFSYKTNPRAIVTITKSNNMYVITFGSAYFLVDKFCDRKFAFEFAKRSEYKDIKTTALNAPNSQRNKVINSYNRCSELIYDSGQSYSKIKANMKVDEGEERFNGTIEIGTSIRFSMKENSINNIVKIIDYVEQTLEKDIIHNIPLFLEVGRERIEELDCKLIKNLKNKNAEVKFSEFDIIGVNETFNHSDLGFNIRFRDNVEFIEELDCDTIVEFIDTYKIDNEDILNIEIEIINDEFSQVKSLKEIIDFTDDTEKVVISNGIWYEYNDDYLNYLKESIAELDVEYESEYDDFDNIYIKYIDDIYNAEKDKTENIGMTEDEIKNKLKKKSYKERVFNVMREEKDGFENHDREIETANGNKFELMDLYKDKTMYAVKIGNSSAKLSYAIEQSIVAMRMLKTKNIELDVEKICIWLVLERKQKLKTENGKVDLNDLDMLMLKNRIDSWKKEIRVAGYKPIIKINYTK